MPTSSYQNHHISAHHHHHHYLVLITVEQMMKQKELSRDGCLDQSYVETKSCNRGSGWCFRQANGHASGRNGQGRVPAAVPAAQALTSRQAQLQSCLSYGNTAVMCRGAQTESLNSETPLPNICEVADGQATGASCGAPCRCRDGGSAMANNLRVYLLVQVRTNCRRSGRRWLATRHS